MRCWYFESNERGWSNLEDSKPFDIDYTSIKGSAKKEIRSAKGDLIFWFRLDEGKKGIWAITEIISEAYSDSNINTGWRIDILICKIFKPVIPLSRSTKLEKFFKKMKARQQASHITLLESEEAEMLFEVTEYEHNPSPVQQRELNPEIFKLIDSCKEGFDKANSLLDMSGMSKYEFANSNILGDILDPYGGHLQGAKHLKLFLDHLDFWYPKEPPVQKIIKNLSLEHCKVYREKRYEILGPSKSKERFRQLDLLIHDKKNDLAIIIENKISAKDSNDQLQAYHDYAKTAYSGGYILLYLNRFGDDPTAPTGEEYAITHEFIARRFLNDCIDNAEDHSRLRNVLVEFKHSLLATIHEAPKNCYQQMELLHKLHESPDLHQKVEAEYVAARRKETIPSPYSQLLMDAFPWLEAYIELYFMSTLMEGLRPLLSEAGMEIEWECDEDIGYMIGKDSSASTYHRIRRLDFERKRRPHFGEKDGPEIILEAESKMITCKIGAYLDRAGITAYFVFEGVSESILKKIAQKYLGLGFLEINNDPHSIGIVFLENHELYGDNLTKLLDPRYRETKIADAKKKVKKLFDEVLLWQRS